MPPNRCTDSWSIYVFPGVLLGWLCVLIGETSAQRVEWRKADGGNGHAYEVVPGRLPWTAARDAALRRGGHLATITSAAENAFVLKLLQTPSGRPHPRYFAPGLEGRRFGPWLGAEQAADAGKSDEGWSWVTGEPFEFAAWADGEPSDYGGQSERVVHYFMRTPNDTPAWNDTVYRTPSVRAYIVEYEPPPETAGPLNNEDTPATSPSSSPSTSPNTNQPTAPEVETTGSWLAVIASLLISAAGGLMLMLAIAILILVSVQKKSASGKGTR